MGFTVKYIHAFGEAKGTDEKRRAFEGLMERGKAIKRRGEQKMLRGWEG